MSIASTVYHVYQSKKSFADKDLNGRQHPENAVYHVYHSSSIRFEAPTCS